MSRTKNFRILASLIFLLAGLFSFTGSVQGAGNAVVSISAPGEIFQPGEQFTVNINVDPNNDIAGLQFNLSFDPAYVTVNSISEGNLLNQDGDPTFFNTGQINNTAGTISGVFGAILNPGESVSATGSFAVISMTAGNSGGICPLTLSNVIVGNVESQSVPATLVNQSVTIESGDEEDSSEDPAPVIGGGGGSTDDKRFTNISGSSSTDGVVWEEVIALSVDIRLELVIPQGTTVLNGNGYPLYSITVATLAEPGLPPDEADFIGYVYDLTPEGTTFDPYAILNMYYVDSELPEGVNEENIRIYTRNEISQVWEELECQVNTETNCITSIITHFSDYTIAIGSSPARLSVEQLSVTPQTIERGNGQINITAKVTNAGDQAGSYEAALQVNGAVTQTRNVYVDGHSSQDISFTYTPQSAGQFGISLGGLSRTVDVTEPSIAPLAGAVFQVSGISFDPVQPEIGQPVNIDIIVANTGEQQGTYSVVAYINEIPLEPQDIALDAGASGAVRFTYVPESEGTHVFTSGGMEKTFEIIPSAIVEQLPLTPVRIDNLSVASIRDEANDRLQYSRVTYQMSQPCDTINDTLVLSVLFNDILREQILLMDASQLQPDGITGILQYVPSSGWEAGEYSFKVDLVGDDNIVQDTAQQNIIVNLEDLAEVVSWKTLGIIITVASGIGVLIVGIVLYFRRDMLRGRISK